GVPEYLVLLTFERTVHWFVLEDGEYVAQQADAAGVLRSRIFPGLWLDVDALLAQDMAKLLSVLQQGLATPEHAAFVAKLNPPDEAAGP
ncbi:MAG: Uma2 family endonuclease, partial [Caldilineaceae bacterium]|nr:Uma2 family endonuclease [Caldilineaceae bacterium]